MSNLSKSYDKMALGLALVIALGLGAMVYLNAGKLDKDFVIETNSRAGMPEPDKDAITAVTSAVGAPVSVVPPKDKDDWTRLIVSRVLFQVR